MSDKEQIDVCGDGSVLKHILVEGTGDEVPDQGTKCTVHYVGTLLDGSKFDSSRDRNDPFKFSIGQGVIEGWSLGVASMKLGEKADFTITSDKAYGDRGSPPKIPGGATLMFEIELLHFTNDIEVTQDGGVTMKHVKRGEGWATTEDMAACSVHYDIKVKGDVVFDTRTAGEAVVFFVGDGGVMRGIELAAQKMKQGDIATVNIRADYGFGVEGSALFAVPAHADVAVTLELVSVVNPKQPYEIVDFGPCLDEATQMKQAGNKLFAAQKYDNAIRRYDHAIKFSDKDAGLTDDEKAQMKQLTVSCQLNAAQCLIKSKRAGKAKQRLDKVLALDSSNVKAFFRRGVANHDLGDFQASTKDLKSCLALDPENKAAQQALKKTANAAKSQNNADKKMFSKMFG